MEEKEIASIRTKVEARWEVVKGHREFKGCEQTGNVIFVTFGHAGKFLNFLGPTSKTGPKRVSDTVQVAGDLTLFGPKPTHSARSISA
jgi:hypothetical protein